MMLAAWMLFTVVVSALLFGAAWLADMALRSMRRSARAVWLGSAVLSALLPVAAWFMPAQHGVPVHQLRISSWDTPVTSDSVLQTFTTSLVVLWIIALCVGLLLCIIAAWRITRERVRWHSRHVDGTPVLVSHDIGPALVGVLHYSIVVPEWALTLDEHARQLLVLHEREHARAYDPLMLTVAVLLVVVAPWNVFNWLFLKRLHLAVELDCDQRVLRANPDTAGYGALLLDVAERVLPSAVPAAAFVEHGASLDKRIAAMLTSRTAGLSFRTVGSGVASALLLLAACVAPQPYASLPPAQRASRLANDLAKVLSSDSATHAVPTEQRAVIVQSVSAAARAASPAHSLYASGIDTVQPSAYVAKLERAEERRVHDIVDTVSQALGNQWSRADSALVLLFNADGQVVRHSGVKTSAIVMAEPPSMFYQLFMPPAIQAMAHAEERPPVTTDSRGRKLDVPLRVFTGYMLRGAPVPLTRAEVVPTHEAMVAALRGAHPEVLSDTSSNPLVGALLYGSHGELLGTGAIRADVPAVLADGRSNPDFDATVFRRAFGAVMDSGIIAQSGRKTYFDSTTPHDGAPRLLYAVLVKREEAARMLSRLQYGGSDGMISWSSARRGTLPNSVEMDRRLRNLAYTRVPESFGAWSRADSAVLFVFDADDQLIARSATPVVEAHGLSQSVDALRKHWPHLDTDDVDATGFASFPTSATGRELDVPLTVKWAKLRRGARLSPPS